MQSLFEENGDIDEVGCIDVLRSGGTWLWDDLALSEAQFQLLGSILGSPGNEDTTSH